MHDLVNVKGKKVIIIIQARIGSTRFPRKVLAHINSKPMIWHVINRAKKVQNAHQVILATTRKKEDMILLKISKDCGIVGYTGNAHDVLSRYYHCAEQHKADIIVRITGDCPLVDPKLIERMLKTYIKNKYDYVSNTIVPTYPDGLDVEIFSFNTLKLMFNNAKLKSEREHVTSYIRNNMKKFRVLNFTNNQDLSKLRWTVDEKSDITFVRRIYSRMKKKNFSTKDVLKIISKNPELEKINQIVRRNEGYLKSLKKDHLVK